VISKRHPLVARIVASWRLLTGGSSLNDEQRRTLIACSGGADSSALAIALAQVRRSVVIGHVLHDLRPLPEAMADRDAARELAERLGVPFAEAAVTVLDQPGNPEAVARRERYVALEDMAISNGCVFVATAHHAGDQLETVLMRLLRGTGPRGLRGIAPRRRLSAISVVRPMLCATHADCEELCREASWKWREDRTNADTSRLRSALRHRVIPLLFELKPDAAQRASVTAELMREVADAIRGPASELAMQGFGDCDLMSSDWNFRWPREELRTRPAVVIAESLREIVRTSAVAGLDRLPYRGLLRVAHLIKDPCGSTRTVRFRSLTVAITRDTVSVKLNGDAHPKKR
jgi:tRNA(Ile)-lysidine synthetase-like protein